MENITGFIEEKYLVDLATEENDVAGGTAFLTPGTPAFTAHLAAGFGVGITASCISLAINGDFRCFI
jgi:hypothetical protein